MGLFTPSKVCVTCKTSGSTIRDEQCQEEIEVSLRALAPFDSNILPPIFFLQFSAANFLPPFSQKAYFCHKARGRFIPSQTLNAHLPPMYRWGGGYGDAGYFLGSNIFEGAWTSSSLLASHGLTSCGWVWKASEGAAHLRCWRSCCGRMKSPPSVKVLVCCFLEKPSQIKADIENIRLSMILWNKFKFIINFLCVCFFSWVCVSTGYKQTRKTLWTSSSGSACCQLASAEAPSDTERVIAPESLEDLTDNMHHLENLETGWEWTVEGVTWYSPLETIQGNSWVFIQYNTVTDQLTLSVQYMTSNTLHPVNTRKGGCGPEEGCWEFNPSAF